MDWSAASAEGLDLHHVGVVALDVVMDGEPQQARTAATCSRQGPPYLELVQELSGGVWGPGALTPAEGPERFSDHSAGPELWWELVSTAFRPRLSVRLAAAEEGRA